MTDFPREFRIGGVRIAPATVLAPMAGVTDTVFRRLIRSQGGCGLIMTEFTSSHGVVASLGNSARRSPRARFAICISIRMSTRSRRNCSDPIRR